MLLRKMSLGIQWKILLILFLMNLFWEVKDFRICFQTHARWPDVSEIELTSENTTQKPANSAKIAILILKFSWNLNFSCAKLMMWPGECSGSKKFISFLKSFLRYWLTILCQKIWRKSYKRLFSAIWNWKFLIEKSTNSGTFNLQLQRNFFWQIRTCHFVTN